MKSNQYNNEIQINNNNNLIFKTNIQIKSKFEIKIPQFSLFVRFVSLLNQPENVNYYYSILFNSIYSIIVQYLFNCYSILFKYLVLKKRNNKLTNRASNRSKTFRLFRI